LHDGYVDAGERTHKAHIFEQRSITHQTPTGIAFDYEGSLFPDGTVFAPHDACHSTRPCVKYSKITPNVGYGLAMDSEGLKHELRDGDAVILSSGALATVRGSYPEGYRGDVRIVIDGVEEMELASALTAAHAPLSNDASSPESDGPDPRTLTRTPSRRMED
jgi:hypothetical protein